LLTLHLLTTPAAPRFAPFRRVVTPPSVPAPSGENTKRRQLQYDGLGRVTSVCEVTAGTSSWPGGSCGQNVAQTGYLASYTYDALGHLTGATMNNQSSTKQSRSYTYDGLGSAAWFRNRTRKAEPLPTSTTLLPSLTYAAGVGELPMGTSSRRKTQTASLPATSTMRCIV